MEHFFFGSRYNLKILWEYCTLSKFDLDENPGILDEGDKMRLADYKELMGFYLQHETMKTSDEDTIMELFNYFVNRDMILLASLMQSSDQPLNENTLLRLEDTEKQNVMFLQLLIWTSIFLQKRSCFTEIGKEKSLKMYGLNSLLSNLIALACLSWTPLFSREARTFSFWKKDLATLQNVMDCYTLKKTPS